MNYSKQFKSEREASHLTQIQVAKRLGMGSAQYISNVERGKCRLATSHYKILAQLFGRVAVTRLIEVALKEERRAMYGALGK